MTTPAGWYDDGSGRQRWWDGQQWTEHFAPEAAAAAAPESEASPVDDIPAAEEPSLDDTVVRPSETVITPDSAQSWSAPETASTESAPPTAPAPESAPYVAPGETASSAQYGAGLSAAPPAVPPYGAPAAPAYAAPAYPGAVAGQPGAGYSGGYPAAAPYAGSTPEGPKKVSVLGLIGLGLSVLGTILAFIPVVNIVGFFVLAAGFIVSLISIFLKGKKWPGITGLILAVVGTIIGVVLSLIYLVAFAQDVSEQYDRPTSTSTSAPADPGESAAPGDGTRPTSAEVAVGIATLIEATGAEGYTDEQINCMADEFVASPIDDDTLRRIAESDGTFTDSEAVVAFTEQFSESISVCLVP